MIAYETLVEDKNKGEKNETVVGGKWDCIAPSFCVIEQTEEWERVMASLEPETLGNPSGSGDNQPENIDEKGKDCWEIIRTSGIWLKIQGKIDKNRHFQTLPRFNFHITLKLFYYCDNLKII